MPDKSRWNLTHWPCPVHTNIYTCRSIAYSFKSDILDSWEQNKMKLNTLYFTALHALFNSTISYGFVGHESNCTSIYFFYFFYLFKYFFSFELETMDMFYGSFCTLCWNCEFQCSIFVLFGRFVTHSNCTGYFNIVIKTGVFMQFTSCKVQTTLFYSHTHTRSTFCIRFARFLCTPCTKCTYNV